MMTEKLIEDREAGGFNPVTPGEVPVMLVVVLLSSSVALLFSYFGGIFDHEVHSANYVMVFITGVLYVSIRSSRRTALFCSLLSVLCYDFFFVQPYYSLIPSDRQYFVVVIFMFVVALVVNELAYLARLYANRANLLQQEAETERIKNTLLRSVSHDLKSPLTSIMGAATLLSEEMETPLSDSLKKELAESIAFESSRLNRIVSNLLDMTRLESGGIKLHRDWYHLEELLASAISAIETRYGAQEIDVDLPSDIPLIEVDPILTEQLLTNILDNCVKYAPAERYEIDARVERDSLVVRVHNGGKVLEDEDLTRVFEKFHRGDTTKPGAGLGLSICQSIVQLHGGSIWFESGITDGATLAFTLPLPQESPALLPEEQSEETGETN